MNVFDYFFENNKTLNKDFLLNNNDKLSYKGLYSKSLILASYIKDNVGVNKNILLISQNSSFFIITYLAILKSGNVCVPLNFQIEQNNLEKIIATTESSFAFVSNQVINKIDLSKVKEVITEDLWNLLLSNDKEVAEFKVATKESTLAEIIFTSGSTGEPKGVMISHRNIIANTNSIIEYLKLSSNDIICVVLPFFYCYGLSLLHTHLRVGGSMVLNNTFLFLGTVIDDLKNYNCTGFAGVPSHFQMLLKKAKTFKSTKFPSLRYVTQAGGKLHNVFIEEFISSFPDKNFFVMYGQTEATARLAYLPPSKLREKMGSIGVSIPNVKLKVVNEKGIEVGCDEEGELIANGTNIMQGYYKDILGTNEVIKNGWLYTGDIAKKDNDGVFYIVGRKKEIIKVGGNRVSPKEIESVILEVSQVIDCTIKSVYDNILGESLKAEIVIDNLNNKEKVKQLILMHCKEKLALYKIPQMFEFYNKLNVKITGKK